MTTNLPEPPKYKQVGPSTIADWVSFWRWLVGMWRYTRDRIDGAQSIALAPRGPAHGSDQSTLAAAQAFSQGRVAPTHKEETDAAGIEAYAPRGVPAALGDLGIAFALRWPPYPTKPFTVIRDTHANRTLYPADSYDGFLYWETSNTIPDTDRTSLYLSVSNIWEYVGGEMQSVDTGLADLPTDLGMNDARFRFRNSFFQRAWEWEGSGWHYADAGLGAGSQVSTDNGIQPSGGLWVYCDGSSAACALDDATIANLFTTNTAVDGSGNMPVVMGGGGGARISATVQTFDNIYGGTATQPNTSNDSADSQFVAGVGAVNGAANGHYHQIPPLFPPSETAGGMPLRVSMSWWMRR